MTKKQILRARPSKSGLWDPVFVFTLMGGILVVPWCFGMGSYFTGFFMAGLLCGFIATFLFVMFLEKRLVLDDPDIENFLEDPEILCELYSLQQLYTILNNLSDRGDPYVSCARRRVTEAIRISKLRMIAPQVLKEEIP